MSNTTFHTGYSSRLIKQKVTLDKRMKVKGLRKHLSIPRNFKSQHSLLKDGSVFWTISCDGYPTLFPFLIDFLAERERGMEPNCDLLYFPSPLYVLQGFKNMDTMGSTDKVRNAHLRLYVLTSVLYLTLRKKKTLFLLLF